MKVVILDKYYECDYVFLDVTKVETAHDSFKIIKGESMIKEFDSKRFRYRTE